MYVCFFISVVCNYLRLPSVLWTHLPKWLTTETVDGEQMSLFEGHEALAETDKMDAAPRGNGRARVGN